MDVNERGSPKHFNVKKNIYEGSCTCVRNMYEETDNFRVRIGVH